MIDQKIRYSSDLNTKHQYVYLISDGKHQKIGITTNTKTRLSSLQSSNPRELTLVASYLPNKSASTVEFFLHRKYAEHRKRGEWFNINITEEEFISTCKEIDKGRTYFGELAGIPCAVCKSPVDDYEVHNMCEMYLGRHQVCSDGCLNEFLMD